MSDQVYSKVIKKILIMLRTELHLAPGLILKKQLAVTSAKTTGLVVNTIGIRVLPRWSVSIDSANL